MKKIIISAALLMPVIAFAQKGFTIKGKLSKVDAPAIVYLRYAGEDKKDVIDSSAVKKGAFAFKGSVSEPRSAVLSIKRNAADTVKSRNMDYFFFYLENANMTIAAADSIKYATLKGSPVNKDNEALNDALKNVKAKAAALRAAWTGVKKDSSNAAAYKAAADSLQAFNKEYSAINQQFIETHRNSYIALITFANTGLAYDYDPAVAEKELGKFSAGIQATKLGKKLAEKIDLAKKTVVGVTAQDFTQNDVNGKPVKLSDYKGKYVLVDFWASWCMPCRAENPNLIAAYNKYKDKNFTILGISLDEEKSRNAWLKAIEKDGVTWTQVSDLKGWQNEAAQLYSVTAIPSNFLVDPTGKIIARNLRGDDLNKTLQQALN